MRKKKKKKKKNTHTENPRIPQICWGDFRFNLGLPGPRGGRRWTRLVPQFDFLQFSSKSGLWEGISWPFFILKNSDIRNVMRQGKHTTRQPLANLVREILVMEIGCSNFRSQVVIDVANFAKTENGHETGPQGPDLSLDP